MKTSRSITIKELAIGFVALVVSLGFGVGAAGGLGGPEPADASEVVVNQAGNIEMVAALECPTGANGFPTAVDPTCIMGATGELVDAVEVD